MTKYVAAQRLGVAEHHITAIDEHPEGHVVTLRDGQRMLISATVARAYVPEVDDAPARSDVDAAVVPAEPKAEDKPLKRGAGRPRRTY